MGGQVALVGAHLVEASCDELVQAHKGVGVEAARVCVVLGSGVEGYPFVHQLLGGQWPLLIVGPSLNPNPV